MEEPWHVEDCACTQAMPTLQQYEIPVIQKMAQVLNVQKTKLPMFGLDGGLFFFLFCFFLGFFPATSCFPSCLVKEWGKRVKLPGNINNVKRSPESLR